ncbi:hypothetical protein [Aromatoleum anaerobium]|uniref:Uncharacterized protein n=1 Tax=Aromatoleum anaerobium TaxID=182180 RepID=A0ABX1PS81_9RHOO|nr:hypothetical protein [Aromatoleum anaerobium]MCK0506069.1 hypothetical protein [Aromatoleum anaerobium]
MSGQDFKLLVILIFAIILIPATILSIARFALDRFNIDISDDQSEQSLVLFFIFGVFAYSLYSIWDDSFHIVYIISRALFTSMAVFAHVIIIRISSLAVDRMFFQRTAQNRLATALLYYGAAIIYYYLYKNDLFIQHVH